LLYKLESTFCLYIHDKKIITSRRMFQGTHKPKASVPYSGMD